MVSNFVGLSNPKSPMSLLSSSPVSMKCVYGLAALFRGLIDGIMTGIGESGCSVLHRPDDGANEDLGTYKPVYFEDVTVGDLLPSKTRQVKTMNKCIVLTEGEFRSLNETSVPGNCEHEEKEQDEDDFLDDDEDLDDDSQ